MEHISDHLFDNLMHFKYFRNVHRGCLLAVNFRLPLCRCIYIYIYIDKYTNIKCKEVVNCGKNRVCVGGEHVCTLAPITVPSLNQFSCALVH